MAFATRDSQQRAKLGPGNLPRRMTQLSEPKAPQKMGEGFCDEKDRLKGIPDGFLPLLRNHDGPASL